MSVRYSCNAELVHYKLEWDKTYLSHSNLLHQVSIAVTKNGPPNSFYEVHEYSQLWSVNFRTKFYCSRFLCVIRSD